MITKRNIEIKRSYELSKEGIVIDPYFYEPETTLMRQCRTSAEPQLRHVYEDFAKLMARLAVPPLMKPDAVLGRCWKYLNQETKLA